MNKLKSAAVIPCRTGSKEIPDKNFKDFCGKPLIKWTQEAAIESGVFEKVIVSSDGGLRAWHLVDQKSYDDNTIKPYNGVLHYDDDRPEKYSTDTADLDPLIRYYVEKYPDIKLWCLLQPTSPLRTAEDIQKAYKKACFKKYDALVSVTKGPGMYWIEGVVSTGNIATYKVEKRPTRQTRNGWYRENGAIYFVKKYAIWHTGCRCAGYVGLYKMPQERSYEIDSELDWKICEFLMKEGGKCQQG